MAAARYHSINKRLREKGVKFAEHPNVIRYKKNKSKAQKIREGTSWKALSKRLRYERPICEECNVNDTDHIHHIVPIVKDPSLAFDESNLLAVCKECHNKIETSKYRYKTRLEKNMTGGKEIKGIGYIH